MPNLVRIGPTVWISIPDTHTHTRIQLYKMEAGRNGVGSRQERGRERKRRCGLRHCETECIRES